MNRKVPRVQIPYLPPFRLKEKRAMTKTKWRRDVRLAVDLFGVDGVAKELRVGASAVQAWMKGLTTPSPESTIPNRLASLLKE